MHYLWTALVYVGFYGMIAVAIYVTQSAWPLLALICSPKVEFNAENKNKEDTNANG